MYSRSSIIAGVVSILIIAPAFAKPGGQPTAGFYSATVLTTAATPAATCAADGSPLNSNLTGSFYYPGPGQHGAFFEQTVNVNGQFLVFVQRYHSATPAVGKTTWTGTLNTGHSGQRLLVDRPFYAELTFLDEDSFEEDLTFTAVGCTRTYRQVFIRSS